MSEASAPRRAPRRGRLAALWIGAAALSALTLLQGIQPNDEGLMLQAAARIADGQVPYGDFWWFYPPGQPYLLAALEEVVGPSLLTWRVVRVAADATVAVLVWVLARRAAGPRSSFVAWLAAAGAMAFPSGPHPTPLALVFALGALAAFERRPAAAGVLAGLCAAWRLEFAAYLGLGVLLALVWRDRRAAARPALRFAGAAAATALVLYAPVVLAAGLGESFELLVRYPLLDFGDFQTLPLPLDYDGPLNTSSPWGFVSDSAEELLHFYLPVALLVLLGASVAALARRWRAAAPLLVAMTVFAIGMAHYLLVRPDLFHTAPLTVAGAVLGAWALAATTRATAARALTAVVAVGLAWVVAEGVDRRVRTAQDDMVRLDLPVADGVRDRAPRAEPLTAAVHAVRRRVPPGEPIYVTTLRADLVTSGHPLFYVLAQRPNPTRYDIAAPGVVTSAPVQREIVRDLERAGRPLVVRFASPLTAQPEPNAAGRSSGVRLLDAYLARAYRPVERHGPFVLLEARRP